MSQAKIPTWKHISILQNCSDIHVITLRNFKCSLQNENLCRNPQHRAEHKKQNERDDKKKASVRAKRDI